MSYARRGPLGRARGLTLPAVAPAAAVTLAVAVVLSLVSFVAGGGLSLGSATGVEMGLTLGGGLAVTATLTASARSGPTSGVPAAALLFALAALTALSVGWSVQPELSWQEASRTLAYAAFFGAAVALVWAWPGRWDSVLGGIALAGVAVAGYALLTKVFPAQLNANEIYARLREPYGYWNAIGLTAAMAVLPCLWLGARRSGHAAVNALAYPAVGLLLVTLMLAYSRGALLALALGLALWFAVTPLRLRGAAVLLTGALGAAAVVLWTFAQHALTKDRIALADRSAAGHQLGVLLLAMAIALLVAGLAIGFASSRWPPAPRARRRAGTALLVALLLVPVALAGALALSKRGLTGSISHDFNSLTDPHAKVPRNDPSRLTAIGSVRARYWNEALKVWQANPALGAGAGTYGTARLRYRDDTLDVLHAHGYLVQTMSDLGLVGLVLTLALLGAWLAAAVRSSRPVGLVWAHAPPSAGAAGRRRLAAVLGRLRGGRVRRVAEPYTPERVALLTMLALVVMFGVHSLVDWTWFVPGNACVALLCAGWLAGRGPTRSRFGGEPGTRLRQRSAAVPHAGLPLGARLRGTLASVPARVGVRRAVAAAGALVVAVVAAWAEWQPLRSQHAANQALASLASNPSRALGLAQTAVHRDPLSVYPLFDLSAIQSSAGQSSAARRTLVRAVRLQPANAQTWLALASFDVAQHPRTALADLRPALFLDPEGPQTQAAFLTALRASRPGSRIAGTVPIRPVNNPGSVGPSG